MLNSRSNIELFIYQDFLHELALNIRVFKTTFIVYKIVLNAVANFSK